MSKRHFGWVKTDSTTIPAAPYVYHISQDICVQAVRTSAGIRFDYYEWHGDTSPDCEPEVDLDE